MKIPKETATFRYVNLNPKNQRQGDCVTRAIANAEGISWNKAYMHLMSMGFKKKTMPDCPLAYENYLKELGYNKASQPKKEDGKKYRVAEFFKDKKGTYIVSCKGHLTLVRDGVVEDIWDCNNQVICNYWFK